MEEYYLLLAARLDIQIEPLFADNDMHYYRTFVKILNKPGNIENIGFILHCKSCGNRKTTKNRIDCCDVCDSKIQLAGPLWIGKLLTLL